MNSYRDIKYRNPPIVEVICEFRFALAEPWDPAIPGLVYERFLKDTFPIRRARRTVQSEARAESRRLYQEVQFTELAQFLREDELAFVQVGPNLLSINHLEPYPTWEMFKPLIQQGLKAYVDVAAPSGVRRIGLRFTNHIEIPHEQFALEDYFSFRPFYVGPGLPPEVNAFVVGIRGDYDGGQDTLRLQLNSIATDKPDAKAFLLDLDYFLSQPESVSLEQVLDWIEQAHDRVQAAFEACLTDELREIFGVVQE